MTSKEVTRHCDKCDKRTTWYIETNRETGWRRERCLGCVERAKQEAQE